MDTMEEVQEKPFGVFFDDIDFSKVHDDINQTKLKIMMMEVVEFALYELATDKIIKMKNLSREFVKLKKIDPKSEEQTLKLEKIKLAYLKLEKQRSFLSQQCEDIFEKKMMEIKKLCRPEDGLQGPKIKSTKKKEFNKIIQDPDKVEATLENIDDLPEIELEKPQEVSPLNDPNGDHGWKRVYNKNMQYSYESCLMANDWFSKKEKARATSMKKTNDTKNNSFGSDDNGIRSASVSPVDNESCKLMPLTEFHSHMREYELLIKKEYLAFCRRYLKEENYDPSWKKALDYVADTQIVLLKHEQQH